MSLIPLLPTLYLLPLHPHHCLVLLAVFLHLLLPLPLTPSGFFNGMLEVSKPGALNFYTFFHVILLTLFLSRDLILTYLPLSRSLDSLLCDLITPTPSLAFSLQMLCMLAAVSSYLLGRAYPSRKFLPPLFLHLILTLVMQESTSL